MRFAMMSAGLSMMILGCGGASGPELIEVSGTVTYQAKPIKDGVIKFIPVAGSQAPTRSVPIKDRAYTASGRAALGIGTYKTEITAYTGDSANTKPHLVSDAESEKNQPKPREQILPEKYNTKSELDELTVEAGSGAITKDFKLE